MPAIPPPAKPLFLAAIRLPPDAWPAFLDEQCGSDADLRRRVERLLAAHRAADTGDGPPDPNETVGYPTTLGEEEGDTVGPYRLLERIGEGGMGVVYVAEQHEPVKRRVALKVIKPGMDSKEVVARFEAERQALALMDHPNIARVLDGGTTDRGRPYFVMELVRGLPATDYCDQARLPAEARLRLFTQVCRAVQHAHQKGVIHRDLKPSNVLVTVIDGEPVPKVIDFGVAKAVSGPLTDKTVYTRLAQMVGTPLYMAPEQAELSGVDVDTRADVYALGVLLYELLTGATPFDPQALRAAGFDEMRRMIREDDPPRPSHRLSTLDAKARSTVSERRGVDDRRLGRLLRGDLDRVVMKALEKDRNRRYQSPAEFAADVDRFLADEPVEARPASTAYRLRKFARRNKVALGVSGVVAVVLVAGTAVSLWQAVRATRAEGQAVRAAEETGAALTEARAQRARARRAVDEMYTQVAERWLADRGDLTAVQKEFLSKALALYQGFAGEPGADPDDQYEVVRALDRVGAVHQRLGDHAAAEAAFRRAIEGAADLAAGHPDRAEFRLEVGAARARLAQVLWKTGREPEAATEAGRASAELHPVVAAAPSDPGHRRRLAESLERVAGTLTQARREQEAAAAVTAAVTVWEGLVRADPADVEARYGLAQCLAVRGMQRMWWGKQVPEAEASLREAVARLSALSAERPGDARTRRALAFALVNLGVVTSWTKRDAESLEVCRRVLALCEGLAAEFPDDPDAQRGLATALNNLSTHVPRDRVDEQLGLRMRALDIVERLVAKHPDNLDYLKDFLNQSQPTAIRLRALRRDAEAIRLFERGVGRAAAFLRAHPAHPTVTRGLSSCAILLAEARLDNGDYGGAARAFDDARPAPNADPTYGGKGGPDDDGAWLAGRAGWVLRGCAARARLDATRPPTDREAEARGYETRADTWLAEAARAADEWARKAAPMAGDVVRLAEELFDGVPDWYSPHRREASRWCQALVLKAAVREAVRRAPDDKNLYLVADVLSTAPEWFRDPDLGLRLARRAAELHPADGMCQQSLAWALYRAGDWAGSAEAVGRLKSESHFVLAMAHHRLGRADEARAAFARGDEWLAGYEGRWAERAKNGNRTHPFPSMLRRMRGEAADLLGLVAPPPREVRTKPGSQ